MNPTKSFYSEQDGHQFKNAAWRELFQSIITTLHCVMAGIIIQLSPAISRGFRGKRGTREVLM